MLEPKTQSLLFKDVKNIHHANSNLKREVVAVLIQMKHALRQNIIIRDKERYFRGMSQSITKA